jgi:hypothetical protein
MDNTFFRNIVKALGYNVVVNNDDLDNPTAILSPIEPDDNADETKLEGLKLSADDIKTAAELAQQAIVEVKSLREQLGGSDGLEDLIVTLNEARSVIANARASEAIERDALVSQLTANTSVYTEEELKGKPVGELKKLHQLMALPEIDYSLTRSGVHNSEGDLAIPSFFFAKNERKNADT